MFLLDWYKQWLEIRAEAKSRANDITREVKEVEVCQSCETLREQLSLERQTNSKLMDRLLEKPEKVVDAPPQMVTRPTLGRHAPWRVRQQLLQTEDKERAKLLRDAPQPATTDVAELEKELNIASANRAAEATKEG
jgi:translation initiation factor 2B subunit (eIF-2B alpha/beta/delta family)